ncbi:uncharacterized protein LOC131672783 isoform X2 [Phymastichus coffea]|uniref:uncharacterized protein LOC131672783 isoform X2 n=1 Tax=Phymastichus coffea TaxID=108790 RepID=UPI00273CC804|nr:uncharacterized protein LOC131672783 isoform X2 [Phymastichus coffea]
MKPGGATKFVTVQTTDSQGKAKKTTHQPLHTLQPAATDKENLVGAGRQLRSTPPSKGAMKNEMSDKAKIAIKKTVDKSAATKSSTSKKVTDKTKTDNKKVQNDAKRNGRIFKNQAVQTEEAKRIKISSEDLTSEAGPSEDYWKVLAERRRVALQDALEENQILSDQLKVYKEMLDESRALVEVLQDMIGEDRSDINNSLDDSHL